MNLALLARHARERPHQAAIVEARRSVTFAALERDARRAADALHRDGLRRGDVVLVLAPMGIPLYTTLLGLFHLGLVAMFVDPSAGRAHLDRCCDLVRPKAFAGSWRAHLLSWASRPVRRIPIRCGVGVRAGSARGAAADTPNEDDAGGAPDHPAVITFTTGSTGAPKGAVRSEAFLLAQHHAVAAALDLMPGDVDLTTLPMFVLANLGSGVTSVIPDADLRRPGAVDAARIVDQIDRVRPNRTVASPALLDRLARHCLAHGRRLASFDRLFTGGGPVAPSRIDRLRAAAPGARISAVYGSTEAEPIAALDWSDVTLADRDAIRTGGGLPAGRPVPGLRLGILPDGWQPSGQPLDEDRLAAVFLPPGGVGEIVVSGPHVLGGYLGGRGDAEHKIAAGATRWHRTGDAGYLDPAGRLWLLGRSTAALDGRGGRLYPFSVEAAAEECPGVERAALLGVHGRRTLVVEVSNRDRNAVLAALRPVVSFAELDDIRVVSRIPVDPRHNAKIDYVRLRRSIQIHTLGERLGLA